jgi:chromosome segregation ATPase
MWASKNQSKAKEKDTLKELITKSKAIRKNIDTIMSSFRRLEKHMGEIKKSIDKRDSRQQSMSRELEKLIKNMKQLDENIKEKKK